MSPVGPDLMFSEEDFRLVRDMIHDNCGLSFESDVGSILARRLAKRLAFLGIRDFRGYYQLLKYGRDREQEFSDLMDLLTTNETYFFREPKHFDFLRNKILATHHLGRKFRVWSAACSSGE